MSKINILRTIDSINSRINSYTPIIEAIVNSIEAIEEAKITDGEVIVSLKREETLDLEDTQPHVISVKITDNGIGFNQNNRDSFDTFYSDTKKSLGGQGFGRFMFLKFFNTVKITSIYEESGSYYKRKFNFGKKYDIIENETNEQIDEVKSQTTIELNNIKNKQLLEKGLETIARKLVEKLLIFFINDEYKCPNIILREDDGSKEVILNDYVKDDSDIKLIDSNNIKIISSFDKVEREFTIKTFKIFYSNLKSKITLTADNREVVETPLSHYIPEFEDDFYETKRNGKEIKKNYIIKTYVLGDYLNKNVSHERDRFNFDTDNEDGYYPLSRSEIEKNTADYISKIFNTDISFRYEKKIKKITEYINENAPWHRQYYEGLNLKNIPFNIDDEKIEIELQKVKFNRELETRSEIRNVLNGDNKNFEEKFDEVVSKITNIGKSDLAHYVCNRKVVLEILVDLLKRREDGKGKLETEFHQLIYPRGKDSTNTNYEDHNLWLLDERLVFSEYIASDRKIYKSIKSGEPDLLIFNKRQSFRNGDNEYSNPLTIFEFKRPKRESYDKGEDPIKQVGNYLKDIRAQKYEIPEGLEKIKVNENTPVYAYIICDLTRQLKELAEEVHQLTLSPDNEGYFGYHKGYKMYIEIITFSKLLKDAKLRNQIFFEKLHL
jgi:hypothetical protein